MVMENEEKKQITEPTVAKPTEPECPMCEIQPLVMAIGTANAVCHLVKEPTKKEECQKWAQNLSPENVKKAKEVYRGILQHTDDIDEIDKVAREHNAGLREAIIEEVSYRLEKGIPVPEKMMKAYKEKIMAKRT